MAKRVKSTGPPVDQQVPTMLPPGVKLLRTLEGHRDTVLSVAFDPQGGMLASGSADKTVKLWEARSGKLIRTLEGHRERVTSVAFDPEGSLRRMTPSWLNYVSRYAGPSSGEAEVLKSTFNLRRSRGVPPPIDN